MKRLTSRMIAALIFTLVYLLLLALNIVHMPRQFAVPAQHGSNYSPIGDHKLNLQVSFPYGRLQLPGCLLPAGFRLLSHNAALARSDGSRQKIYIGGLWRNSLSQLDAARLNLSSTATFTPSSLTTMYEISPPANGYLNSRIDLRRRRLVLASTSGTTAPSSILLQLGRDAVLQPRNVDPSTLREEFEKAIARNRRLEEALAARKLRKGRKKIAIKVNSVG
ncbi:hypothetical protein OPQ81_006989 [Rhizoctonia solani]|nr:hypothetical protein OPQ81_006989 [Rhizoctonia solani]